MPTVPSERNDRYRTLPRKSRPALPLRLDTGNPSSVNAPRSASKPPKPLEFERGPVHHSRRLRPSCSFGDKQAERRSRRAGFSSLRRRRKPATFGPHPESEPNDRRLRDRRFLAQTIQPLPVSGRPLQTDNRPPVRPPAVELGTARLLWSGSGFRFGHGRSPFRIVRVEDRDHDTPATDATSNVDQGTNGVAPGRPLTPASDSS